jgi:hypothetical protein
VPEPALRRRLDEREPATLDAIAERHQQRRVKRQRDRDRDQADDDGAQPRRTRVVSGTSSIALIASTNEVPRNRHARHDGLDPVLVGHQWQRHRVAVRRDHRRHRAQGPHPRRERGVARRNRSDRTTMISPASA